MKLMTCDAYMVMDFFFSEFKGGAELNAESLIERSVDVGFKIEKIKSDQITIAFLEKNKDKNFIFSNFVNVSEDCIKYTIENLKYVIYEQDHKYIKTRNPIHFVNFVAPKSFRIYTEFYKNAITVFFLTKLAKDVFVANTELENVCNLESSVWTKSDLEFIKEISNSPKTKQNAIMDSNNPIKRRERCIEYCEDNNMEYELISDPDFKTFMSKLANYNRLVFFTGHLETCARILVEAKMLNLKVTCPKKLIGAASEPWFDLTGIELIDRMEEISSNMPNVVMEYFND